MIGAFSQSRDFRFDTLTATSGQPDNRTFHSVLSPSWQLSKNITLQRWDYFWVELIPPASRSDNVEQQVLRFCNSLAYVLHVFEVARLSKVFLLKWLAPPPSEYQVACAITTLQSRAPFEQFRDNPRIKIDPCPHKDLPQHIAERGEIIRANHHLE
jgi:hypothetical protein